MYGNPANYQIQKVENKAEYFPERYVLALVSPYHMINTTLFRKAGLALFVSLFLTLTANSQDFAKFFVFGASNPFNGTTFISSHELGDSSGFLLLGDRYMTSHRNGFVIKTDSALNEVWTTALNFQNAQFPYNDIGFYDIGELMNGNIYVYGVAGPGGTSPHYVLFVLSPAGQILNHIAIHDSLNSTNVANLTSVQIAHDSTIIIPVAEYERYGYYRLDQNLNLLSYAFYTNVFTGNRGRDCILTRDSSILLNSESALTKTDLNGNVLWSKKYSAILQTYSVLESATGSIYVSTYTNMGPTNAALAKFDANGNPVFLKTYSMSPGTATSPAWKVYEFGNDLMIYSDSVMFRTDTNGNVVGQGKTVDAYNNKIMRPGLNNKFTITGQIMQDSVSSYQYTLMRFDDATQMGCLRPRAVVMTPVTMGQSAEIPSLQASAIVHDTIAFNANYVNLDFDALNGCPPNPLGVESVSSSGQINLFPNPTGDLLNVNNLKTGEKIAVVNSLGQIVLEQTASGSLLQINTASWSEGIYFIRLCDRVQSQALMFAVAH